MTTRKSKDEVKKGLEDKNKKLIEEKHHLMELSDMITAIISYNEIDNYKVCQGLCSFSKENITPLY
jgi:hypothetical protein